MLVPIICLACVLGALALLKFGPVLLTKATTSAALSDFPFDVAPYEVGRPEAQDAGEVEVEDESALTFGDIVNIIESPVDEDYVFSLLDVPAGLSRDEWRRLLEYPVDEADAFDVLGSDDSLSIEEWRRVIEYPIDDDSFPDLM